MLGCIPVGVLAWPLRYPTTTPAYWDGETLVQAVNSGPSLAAWLSFFKGVLFMGAFGAIGGLSFWLVWRSMRSQ